MSELLIRKLERRDLLSREEKNVLRNAFVRTQTLRADEDIVHEGDRPAESCLLLDGFAARYNLLADGRRQISAIHIAGDFVDLHSFLLKTMDHGVMTLSPVRVTFVPHATLAQISRDYPHLTRLLWLSTLIDSAIHRRWLTVMGRSTATAQMAHLICELHCRMKEIGLCDDGAFHVPMTQEELGDTLGLSTVHVNRVLAELRNGGVVKWQQNEVTILDLERLGEIGEFDPGYLHLRQEPR